MLQRSVTCCNALQRVASPCNILQHRTTACRTGRVNTGGLVIAGTALHARGFDALTATAEGKVAVKSAIMRHAGKKTEAHRCGGGVAATLEGRASLNFDSRPAACEVAACATTAAPAEAAAAAAAVPLSDLSASCRTIPTSVSPRSRSHPSGGTGTGDAVAGPLEFDALGGGVSGEPEIVPVQAARVSPIVASRYRCPYRASNGNRAIRVRAIGVTRG
jgi:hypothetical protein